MNAATRAGGVVRRGLQMALAVLVAAPMMVVVLVQPQRADAATWAPSAPEPVCVYNEFGAPGLGCVGAQSASLAPGHVTLAASAPATAGGTVQISTTPSMNACVNRNDGSPGSGQVPGCFIAIGPPVITRCVTVRHGDPTELQLCNGAAFPNGMLPRSGNHPPLVDLTGTDGSTVSNLTSGLGCSAHYVNSMPGAFPGDAASASECIMHFPSFPDGGPVDGLLGPSFFWVQNQVLECFATGAGGVNCTHPARGMMWLPIQGLLAPHVSFGYEFGNTPLTVTFENLSEPYRDGTTAWE